MDVTYVIKESRSEAYVGEELVGVCEFSDNEGIRNIYHTEVKKEFGGHGIARKLVEAAAQTDLKMQCDCSYAAHVLGIG